jgi:hypothetical protein
MEFGSENDGFYVLMALFGVLCGNNFVLPYNEIRLGCISHYSGVRKLFSDFVLDQNPHFFSLEIFSSG